MFQASIYRGDSLWEADLPEPEPILVMDGGPADGETILSMPSMLEVFAATGVGKSLFSLGMSLALATGSNFLCWKAPKPRRVLYIDGEMPGGLIRKRFRQMAGKMGIERGALTNLAFFGRDWQKGSMPRLDTPDGARAVKPFLKRSWGEKDEHEVSATLEDAREHGRPELLTSWGAEIVILDNAVCLFDPEGEVDASAWGAGQAWLLGLREKGITSILIHHAGKDPNATTGRGSSSRNDLMDSIMQLGKPPGHKQKQGCVFDFRFTKGRSLFGDAANEFRAWYSPVSGWNYRLRGEETDAKVAQIGRAMGMTARAGQ